MSENQIDELARFVVHADASHVSATAVCLLKRNVLDSIACAVGALDGELIPTILAQAGI